MNNSEKCRMHYKIIWEKMLTKIACRRSKKPSIPTTILKRASFTCELFKRPYCEEASPLSRIKLNMSRIVKDIWFEDRLLKTLKNMEKNKKSTESSMPEDPQDTNISSRPLFNENMSLPSLTGSTNISSQEILNHFIQAITSASGFNGEEMDGWLFWSLVVTIMVAVAAGVAICILVKKAKKTQMTARMRLYTEDLPIQIVDQFETHTLSALRRIELLLEDVERLCLNNPPAPAHPSSPIDTPFVAPRPLPQSPTLPHFPLERLPIDGEDVEMAALGGPNERNQDGNDDIFNMEM